jgi:hypothetical protein
VIKKALGSFVERFLTVLANGGPDNQCEYSTMPLRAFEGYSSTVPFTRIKGGVAAFPW